MNYKKQTMSPTFIKVKYSEFIKLEEPVDEHINLKSEILKIKIKMINNGSLLKNLKIDFGYNGDDFTKNVITCRFTFDVHPLTKLCKPPRFLKNYLINKHKKML